MLNPGKMCVKISPLQYNTTLKIGTQALFSEYDIVDQKNICYNLYKHY